MPRNQRGVNTSHSAVKVKVGVSLSSSAAKQLDAIARNLGISKSKLFEIIAQGDMVKSGEDTAITLLLKNTSGNVSGVTSVSQEGAQGEEHDLPQSTDRDNALQQQLEAKDKIITSLEEKLAELGKIQTESLESVSLESYHELARQSEEKDHKIESLEERVNHLQPLEAQVQQLQHQLQQSVSQENYHELARQSKGGLLYDYTSYHRTARY
jgi:chromosome segregation ATPase